MDLRRDGRRPGTDREKRIVSLLSLDRTWTVKEVEGTRTGARGVVGT